ncbi:MAG: hypothetical protein AB7L90_10225 [Hyphomicrobiaceae bacterium]
MPRLQTEAAAAKALGLDLSTFRHLVACGRLPKPLAELGNLYDMKAVDAALDRLSGIGSSSNALERWRETRKCASS